MSKGCRTLKTDADARLLLLNNHIEQPWVNKQRTRKTARTRYTTAALLYIPVAKFRKKTKRQQQYDVVRVYLFEGCSLARQQLLSAATRSVSIIRTQVSTGH